jgi:hypothetical protein
MEKTGKAASPLGAVSTARESEGPATGNGNKDGNNNDHFDIDSDDGNHREGNVDSSELPSEGDTTRANGEKSDKTLDEDEAKHSDRYGFEASDGSHRSERLSSDILEKRRDTEIERTRKWIKMMKKWDIVSNTFKLKNRVRKGIPDAARGFSWGHLIDIAEMKAKYPSIDELDKQEIDAVVLDEVSVMFIPTSRMVSLVCMLIDRSRRKSNVSQAHSLSIGWRLVQKKFCFAFFMETNYRRPWPVDASPEFSSFGQS